MTFATDSDVWGFLQELARVFGSPKAAAAAFITASPQFQAWRSKVAQCPACRRFVPVDWRNTPPVLGHHLVRNPHGNRPYWLACAACGQPAPCVEPDPSGLAVIRAHIEHHIETIHPDLL